jgi:integrase
MARSKAKKNYPGNATNPIKKPNGTWKIRWRYYPDGQPRWQELPERYYDDAILLRDWLHEQHVMPPKTDQRLVDKEYRYSKAQASKIKATKQTFGWVAEQYLAVKEAEGIKQGTLDSIRTALVNHGAPWTKLPISTLDSDDLNKRYRELLTTLMKSTAVGVMARIVGCLKWANGKGYTGGYNPTTARAAKELKFPTPTLTRSPSRGGLNTTQVAALIAAMPTPQDKLIVRLWVSLGPRTEEMFKLAIKHVDLDAEVPSVVFVGTKGERADHNHVDGSERHRIALERKLVPVVRALIAGRGPDEPLFVRAHQPHGRRSTSPWIDPASWRRYIFKPVVAKLAAQGKLPAKVTPYWLRHTAASLLAYSTKNESMVGDHLRHMDSRTTKLYLHNSDEKRAKVAEALGQTFDGFDDGMFDLVA